MGATTGIDNRFIRTLLIRIPWVVSLLSIMLMAGLSHATQPDTNGQTFTGEITDTLCAKAGSHDQMMQDMKSMGRDKTSCTQKCIQLGAKYVLFDASKGIVYNLDDQDRAEKLAGRKVRVSGILQKKSIKVTSIEAAD
jgi:Protein of unknown function (DUF5818)